MAVLLETACEDVFLGARLAELLTLLLDIDANLDEVLDELLRTALDVDVRTDDTAAVVLASDDFVDDLTMEGTGTGAVLLDLLEDDSLDVE